MAYTRASNGAGVLRHRITVQTKTPTDDGAGGVVDTWTTHVSAWASVQPISAREAYQRGAVSGSVTHRVRMRYQTGVAHSMRVSFGSRLLRIEGVRIIDEENRWLELDCTEEPL